MVLQLLTGLDRTYGKAITFLTFDVGRHFMASINLLSFTDHKSWCDQCIPILSAIVTVFPWYSLNYSHAKNMYSLIPQFSFLTKQPYWPNNLINYYKKLQQPTLYYVHNREEFLFIQMWGMTCQCWAFDELNKWYLSFWPKGHPTDKRGGWVGLVGKMQH